MNIIKEYKFLKYEMPANEAREIVLLKIKHRIISFIIANTICRFKGHIYELTNTDKDYEISIVTLNMYNGGTCFRCMKDKVRDSIMRPISKRS